MAERPGRKRGNGEGSIWWDERHNRFEIKITVGFKNGRQVRHKIYGKTRAEAIAALDLYRRQRDDGIELPKRTLTVAKYMQWWIEESLPGRVKPKTLQGYADINRYYIEPHVGNLKLHELTPAHVDRMVTKLAQKGLSTNTQRLARSVLRRGLQRAVREGTLTRNAAGLADPVLVQPKKTQTALTPAEARQLLDSVKDHPWGVLIQTSLALGLRRGQALGPLWSDLDLVNGTFTMNHTLATIGGKVVHARTNKTRKSDHTVHLPAPLIEALRLHRSRQVAERLKQGPKWSNDWDDLVFTTATGTPIHPDNFTARLPDVTEAAGVGRWTPHQLRHSAASLLIAQGVPLMVVSELLGHSGIRVTVDSYGHLYGPELRDAADAMTKAIY